MTARRAKEVRRAAPSQEAGLDAVRSVLGHMARAVLGDDESVSVGAFTLRPAQRAALRAATHALDVHGGALIADAPGTGKTVMALAMAARFDDVLVLAPAAIRDQWRRAAARAGVTARCETIEGLSHGQRPAPAQLIIVDEAHHLRSPSTHRYRALAELALGRRLLLLTATPVVNSSRDCDKLLALFLGSRASTLTEAERAELVLRLSSASRAAHPLTRLASLASDSDVDGIAQALAELPPPLPVADGAAATSIVRLSLAFAWASSLAALDAALRRRMERGRTLDEELAAGRWPSRDALRAWILGDDATQLAFGFGTTDASVSYVEAREVLARHLRAVSTLRAQIKEDVGRDTVCRADSLRRLLRDHAPRRVVLLAQSAVTARALYAALRAEPGVVAITGDRVQAAAGRWSRDEVLRALGPNGEPYDPTDPRGIRLLIATDILAEGVELQGASVLVHADPTWTPARLEQREGRLAREGQRDRVLVTRFVVPAAASEMLRVRERLLRKSAARVAALKPAGAAAELRRRLEVLAAADPPTITRVAAAQAAGCGFIALLRSPAGASLIAGDHCRGRWRLRRSPRAVIEALAQPTMDAARVSRAQLQVVQRVLRHWYRLRRGTASASDAGAPPEQLLRRLRARLECAVGAAALHERSALAKEISDLTDRLTQLRGDGVERALARALRDRRDGPALLAALRDLVRCIPEQQRPAPQNGAGRITLEALILFVSADGSAPGSGATLP